MHALHRASPHLSGATRLGQVGHRVRVDRWSRLDKPPAGQRRGTRARGVGTTVDAVVASADLEPGDPIVADVVPFPSAMLPSEALTSLPSSGRVRQRVVSGAVITTADVSTAVGPAAFAEPGTAVVGVVDPLASDPSIGLPVAVTSEGIVLVAAATVVGADDEVILIAVPISEAPMVAAAAQLRTVSLLFLP